MRTNTAEWNYNQYLKKFQVPVFRIGQIMKQVFVQHHTLCKSWALLSFILSTVMFLISLQVHNDRFPVHGNQYLAETQNPVTVPWKVLIVNLLNLNSKVSPIRWIAADAKFYSVLLPLARLFAFCSTHAQFRVSLWHGQLWVLE